MNVPNQVAVDDFQAKVRLRRLRRCLGKRHKGRRRGVGGAAQKARIGSPTGQQHYVGLYGEIKRVIRANIMDRFRYWVLGVASFCRDTPPKLPQAPNTRFDFVARVVVRPCR